MPTSHSAISGIVNAETEYLKTMQSDCQQEKGFPSARRPTGRGSGPRALEAAEERERGILVDLDELQKASDLYGKGSLTSPRVTHARSAVLLPATRKLQTSAQ
ncbi:hypothetical protein [Bradyrhizobium diazoefficiens]|uniref:hypothetical protein n=1 Tax=Bradyrhizobium diazoefficiens TaxID=1355477 RepID=UPI00272B9FC0|nr:hypothetical protein [Bradyrhizobium diazoefficiens]WLA67672.1 hypothetical protein QNN01_13910 [Bradyrhizobium diazoefficiens]